jgi:hypothetical protein
MVGNEFIKISGGENIEQIKTVDVSSAGDRRCGDRRVWLIEQQQYQ